MPEAERVRALGCDDPLLELLIINTRHEKFQHNWIRATSRLTVTRLISRPRENPRGTVPDGFLDGCSVRAALHGGQAFAVVRATEERRAAHCNERRTTSTSSLRGAADV